VFANDKGKLAGRRKAYYQLTVCDYCKKVHRVRIPARATLQSPQPSMRA